MRILLTGTIILFFLGGCSLLSGDTVQVYVKNYGNCPVTGLYLLVRETPEEENPFLTGARDWGSNYLRAALAPYTQQPLEQQLERNTYWLGAIVETPEGAQQLVLESPMSLTLNPDAWVTLGLGYSIDADGFSSRTIGYTWGYDPDSKLTCSTPAGNASSGSTGQFEE